MRPPLSDEQRWAIIQAPHLSNADLAQQLGVTPGQVRTFRTRLKRYAWTCPVRYGYCPRCGKRLTIRDTRTQDRFHPACWEAERLEHTRKWIPKRVW